MIKLFKRLNRYLWYVVVGVMFPFDLILTGLIQFGNLTIGMWLEYKEWYKDPHVLWGKNKGKDI